MRFQRLQEWPLDEKATREHILAQLLARPATAGLGHSNLDHLAGVVPLVDGGGDVQPLVTLQPDEAPPEGIGEHLCDLGLADARLALQEQRSLEPERQEHRGGKAPIRHVVAALEQLLYVFD